MLIYHDEYYNVYVIKRYVSGEAESSLSLHS